MKRLGKIVIAGVAGTSLMTLYSYFKSEKEDEQFREPVLLNALIDRSKLFPQIKEESTHPAGWCAHYAIGITFVAAYHLLWRESLCKPKIGKTFVMGSISGLTGIASWKIFFSQHDNPPYNDRAGYYRQLFIAHLIFTAAAVLTYKGLGPCDRPNQA